MVLHTVGPSSMAEDEHKIGDGYQRWTGPILFAVPLVATHYLESKWVLAISLSIVIVLLHEAGGRLHDLCIRLRRTNILIGEHGSDAG